MYGRWVFSTLKITQRYAHLLDKPAKTRGHELTKWHQMLLVIAAKPLSLALHQDKAIASNRECFAVFDVLAKRHAQSKHPALFCERLHQFLPAL